MDLEPGKARVGPLIESKEERWKSTKLKCKDAIKTEGGPESEKYTAQLERGGGSIAWRLKAHNNVKPVVYGGM